jgi:hypothetical protein
MRISELAHLVRAAGVRASEDEFSLRLLFPQIGETLELQGDQIESAQGLVSPMGDPALQLRIRIGGDLFTVIITGDDVVFEPDPDQPTSSAIRVRVSNAPHIVAYSEMLRDVRRFHAYCMAGRAFDNLDQLVAPFVMFRWFIDGALRIGLAPVEAISRWSDAWSRLGADVPLAGWPPSQRWSSLYIPGLAPLEAVSVPPGPSVATLEEFRELAERVVVAQLDDEFVALWNRRLAESAMSVYSRFTSRLPPTVMEVWLYEGSAGIGLEVDQDTAFVQLRIVYSEKTLYLDEIRIREMSPFGLFQKILFNIESYCDAQGLTMRFLASEVGKYALAIHGVYPRGAEERRRALARIKGE